MTKDIFEHHNGIVDDHADGKTQPRQADHVDVASPEGHDQKGADDADGNGNRHDYRTGHTPQKEQQNDNRQGPADIDILAHQLNGVVDISGFIVDLDNFEAPFF